MFQPTKKRTLFAYYLLRETIFQNFACSQALLQILFYLLKSVVRFCRLKSILIIKKFVTCQTLRYAYEGTPLCYFLGGCVQGFWIRIFTNII